MKNALISIIIPTYNRAHLIGDTLESVLDQTYTNWECLVIDDGSQDFTEELLNAYCKKDARIKYYSRPNKHLKGANSCRNYGLEMSNGELVYFFDSDDLMTPIILERITSLFISKQDLDFIFFNYKVFEKNSSNVIIDQINESNNPFFDYFKGAINLATPAVIWRRQSISRIFFDPSLMKSQELNFAFNLYKDRNLKGEYLNEYGFYLRKHQDSIMSAFWKFSPRHLNSDLIVRSNIIKYFSSSEEDAIIRYQSFELNKTLRAYLINCNIWEVIQILLKIRSEESSLLQDKISIIFFKVIYNFSDRNYKFGNAISKLLSKDLVPNFQ